ncbi:MAG: TMEM175 family protein [Pseudomonadota bacterium]
MLRQAVADHLDHDPHFRWRGESVTRIENLSDIVFALSFGMIISATASPTTFDTLKFHLGGIVPVALSFFVMVNIWNTHFLFFRRYGMADRKIYFLNATLLLLVLFVAYPLRFILDSLYAYVLGVMGDWTRMQVLGFSTQGQAAQIIVYYAAGSAIIQIIFALMYAHVFSHKISLDLSQSERALTQRSIWQSATYVAIAGIVIPVALFTPLGPFAGCFLWLVFLTDVIIDRMIKLPGESLAPAE